MTDLVSVGGNYRRGSKYSRRSKTSAVSIMIGGGESDLLSKSRGIAAYKTQITLYASEIGVMADIIVAKKVNV